MRRYFEILSNQKNPLRFLLSYFLRKTGLCTLYTIRVNNVKFRFYQSSFSILLFMDKNALAQDAKLVEKFLKKGDVFIDVGANIGTWTLFAWSKVGNVGKVFSYEPHPTTYKYLRGNVLLNQACSIRIENCGIGNKEGTLYFTNSLDDQNHITGESEIDSIQIPVKKLDDLLELENKIKVLKIDVEGYELFALQGALKTLGKTEVLIFESWEVSQSKYKYTTPELVSFIQNCGFKIYRMGDNGIFTLIENKEYSSKTCENLIAVRDKSILEIN